MYDTTTKTGFLVLEISGVTIADIGIVAEWSQDRDGYDGHWSSIGLESANANGPIVLITERDKLWAKCEQALSPDGKPGFVEVTPDELAEGLKGGPHWVQSDIVGQSRRLAEDAEPARAAAE